MKNSCLNCFFSGNVFKIKNKKHVHCVHKKNNGIIDWSTLKDGKDKCKDLKVCKDNQ